MPGLLDLIQQFAGGAAPMFNQIGQLAIGGQQGYAQQQENQRQAAQLMQQLALHNSMTPYEKQSLQQQSDNADATSAQEAFKNQLGLTQGIAQGLYKPAQAGDPGAITAPGYYEGDKDVTVVPNPQHVPAPFTYRPTPTDITAHPWMGQVGPDGLPMPVSELPAFMKELSLENKNNPQNTAAYEATLQQQLAQLMDPKDPAYDTHKFLVHDALNPGDGSAPDHKAALKVIQDIQTRNSELALAKQKQSLEFSPDAIQGKARLAGAEQRARGAADQETAAANLPDSTLNYWWKQVKSGAVNYTDVLSRFDKAGKERFANYVASIGDPAPVALDQATRTRLQALEPVINSLDDLQQKIAPLANNKTPGSLLASRVLYGLGAGDANSGLISQLEMDRLRGAAQALPGGRAALQTFEQAQIHTPNAWKDSGYNMNEKINTMLNYLRNQREYMFKYGAKSGVVQGVTDTTNPPGQKSNYAPAAAPPRPALAVPPPPSR